MADTSDGADILEAIKSFMRKNPMPEALDESAVLRIHKVLEESQFSIDRSRTRDLIKKELDK